MYFPQAEGSAAEAGNWPVASRSQHERLEIAASRRSLLFQSTYVLSIV
jgi:hypothetical protein